MIELTKEEAVVAQKIFAALRSLPCCIDEFAGLTDEESGWDSETGEELDDCPLWSLQDKLRGIK